MTAPATPGLVLAATGLRAGYPTANGSWREVLRGVDLRLGRGELVALLGPNGSGKSTLLRCLAGTLPLAGGTIDLMGRDLSRWDRMALARRVAVLPQAMLLPDGFRVAELVEMGRTPHARGLFRATAQDDAAVERALAETDALSLADRYPTELSGGEHQRVLLAMAMAQEPELLLLDEPTLHLDMAHQASMLATIERVGRRRDLTVLAVLHDLNLAASFAPRVAVLHEGRLAADGTPESVLRPGLVQELFGVSVDEAYTADGRRYLVPGSPSRT